MSKKIILLSALAAFSLVAFTGCGFVADGPFGWVYTDTKTPVTISTAKSGEKVGRACVRSYFGAFTIGDASIESAMKEAGIKEVHTVNKENFSVFGTYTKQCTLVSGI